MALALVGAGALALAFGALRPAVWSLDLLFVLALGLDLVRTPRPGRPPRAADGAGGAWAAGGVEARRLLPERSGLSRPLERRVELDGGARGAGLSFELHETFPESFRVLSRWLDGEPAPPAADDDSGGPDAGRLDGEGRAGVTRVYEPRLRGSFELGDVRLRVRGPWGLVARQTRLFGAQPVAVEPVLANLRRTLSLAASERWRDLGVRRVARRGGETDFESLREYVRGDEVRRVDWKAFARRGKPIVRDYQVERGQELVLLIDRGRRMRSATAHGRHQGWTKLDWALDAALELAAVATAKGDRVGAAAFSAGLDVYVPPGKGARQLTRISRALFALQPAASEGELARALRELATHHRRRASVIVLSDVADPLSVEAQRSALAQASRRHRIVFAALDDPGVRALAAGEGADVVERVGALELVADRRRALLRLASSGVRVLDALPAEAAGPLLSAWLQERRR